MLKYFLIALGGALGSMARFWIGSTIANRMGTRLPYGTFFINIVALVISDACQAFIFNNIVALAFIF